MSRPTYKMVLVLCCCLVMVAACSGSSTTREAASSAATRSPTPAASTAGPTAPPQPAVQCAALAVSGTPTTGAPSAEAFWLETPAGDRLQAASVGSGSNVVVFVHETGHEGLCGFWPYASWLAAQGDVRAVVLDMCGYGESQCATYTDEKWITNTVAAVSWARAHGAGRVTLVGASMGGIAVLIAAASISPPVDAVVDLSGETQIRDLVSINAARTLTMPVLYAVAPGDPYVTVDAMQAIAAATPTPGTRVVVEPPNAGHGWNLLRNGDRTDWTDLATLVHDWIVAPPTS